MWGVCKLGSGVNVENVNFGHHPVLHRKLSILRSFWENLHWTEKIYTGTAGGAGYKYQV